MDKNEYQKNLMSFLFTREELEKLEYSKKIEKEATTMQVSYSGFTGELDKLERGYLTSVGIVYDISIYDSDKKCTHSFTGIKLEDVKFLDGAVSFSG